MPASVFRKSRFVITVARASLSAVAALRTFYRGRTGRSRLIARDVARLDVALLHTGNKVFRG